LVKRQRLPGYPGGFDSRFGRSRLQSSYCSLVLFPIDGLDNGGEAEVAGHVLGPNPTLLQMHAHAKQRNFHAEAERLRADNEAAAGNQSLVERVKEKLRGSTG